MELFISACLIVAVMRWGALAPQSMDVAFDGALSVITRNFGWFYLWVGLALVVAIVLAASRYGRLKLGAEDEEPEFSLGAWFAMRFAAGMGIGLVFWGVAGPISHYGEPPPGIAARTPEAANAAISLLLAGGLQAVQTATTVFAPPFTLIILLMITALWRGVRADWAAHERHERVLRRRLESLSAEPHGTPSREP